MSTVYLFGAGASRGYRGSRTGVVPPLANDYFSTFRKLVIAADLEVKIGFMVNYIRDTRGISPEEQPTDFDENIEQIFAEIDRELRVTFDETPNAGDKDRVLKKFSLVKTHDQFVFWFAHVLNEIQNGSPCPIYSEMVNQISEGDTLLTFNWDTILDRVLYETGRWFPDDGYGISFDSLLDKKWRDCNSTSSFCKLLKLHGSTNWLGGYVTRNLQTGKRMWMADEKTVDSHWCVVDGSEWFSTYKDRWRPGYQPFSYFFPPNDPITDLPLMPVIIPPKEVKSFDEYASLFNPIWQKAQEALNEADKLVIIGYSFPPTDEHAFSLIDQFISKHEDKMIEIIDPFSEGVVERLRKHIGESVPITVHSATMAEYLGFQVIQEQPTEDEFEKIFNNSNDNQEDLSEDEKRGDFLLETLIFCNFNQHYFDLTTYDGGRYLDCLLSGEFATHVYGAYRSDVLQYRLDNIPIQLPDGETIKICLDNIWILLPIGPKPLTEEAIRETDISDLPNDVIEYVRKGYHCEDNELERFLRRFKAI